MPGRRSNKMDMKRKETDQNVYYRSKMNYKQLLETFTTSQLSNFYIRRQTNCDLSIDVYVYCDYSLHMYINKEI